MILPVLVPFAQNKADCGAGQNPRYAAGVKAGTIAVLRLDALGFSASKFHRYPFLGGLGRSSLSARPAVFLAGSDRCATRKFSARMEPVTPQARLTLNSAPAAKNKELSPCAACGSEQYSSRSQRLARAATRLANRPFLGQGRAQPAPLSPMAILSRGPLSVPLPTLPIAANTRRAVNPRMTSAHSRRMTILKPSEPSGPRWFFVAERSRPEPRVH
ncbi:hypothetical protein PRI8871_00925 [Pseudoprimorskyibacter insulae]|uniref:Uncharacterized protein n=1 Tax=Pseudoprimorskyibacter insulae TaxID=1695997 RepID=A0A2R8AR62_9RHOB|nr:hypothetical protein PRI8871_00925 [Pseudoprimorskyibacter insulae]